jgi:hypothetical protein
LPAATEDEDATAATAIPIFACRMPGAVCRPSPMNGFQYWNSMEEATESLAIRGEAQHKGGPGAPGAGEIG